MPFTASHAAAVLPLRGAGLSTSALVIGAMSPDLPLFLPFLPFSVEQTHTMWSVLELNIALGAAIFLTWHGFLAKPLAWFAPRAVRERLPQVGLRQRLADPAAIAIVLVSLGIGILTHLVWDLFTHADTVVTRALPAYQWEVLGLPMPELAQYASTVIGAVLITAAVRTWWGSAPLHEVSAHPEPLRRYATRAALGAAAIAGPFVGAALVHRGDDTSRQSTLYAVSVTPVVLVLLTAALVALFWHLDRFRADTGLIR